MKLKVRAGISAEEDLMKYLRWHRAADEARRHGQPHPDIVKWRAARDAVRLLVSMLMNVHDHERLEGPREDARRAVEAAGAKVEWQDKVARANMAEAGELVFMAYFFDLHVVTHESEAAAALEWCRARGMRDPVLAMILAADDCKALPPTELTHELIAHGVFDAEQFDYVKKSIENGRARAKTLIR